MIHRRLDAFRRQRDKADRIAVLVQRVQSDGLLHIFARTLHADGSYHLCDPARRMRPGRAR